MKSQIEGSSCIHCTLRLKRKTARLSFMGTKLYLTKKTHGYSEAFDLAKTLDFLDKGV